MNRIIIPLYLTTLVLCTLVSIAVIKFTPHISLTFGEWITLIIAMVFTVIGAYYLAAHNNMPDVDIGKTFRVIYGISFVLSSICALICWVIFFMLLW